jgi:hypothetical protein
MINPYLPLGLGLGLGLALGSGLGLDVEDKKIVNHLQVAFSSALYSLSSRLCLLGSVFSALSSRLCLLGSVFSHRSSRLLQLKGVKREMGEKRTHKEVHGKGKG